MSEMLERVARTICASMGYEPDGFDSELLPSNESEDGWKNWLSFKPEARTAILAMREPTQQMIDAGDQPHALSAVTKWRLMIDAALTHPE